MLPKIILSNQQITEIKMEVIVFLHRIKHLSFSMPSVTFTIEDTSPIISYSTSWRAGHSSDDGSANNYSQSSFTVTNVKDASVSFTFNGTAVEIFGAKRTNHGVYQAKLDNTFYPPSTGKADPVAFQASLFVASNLSQGLHVVTLTNQEANFLDIDFITWETIIGTDSSGQLYVNTFQDTSPSFTYLPSETDWGVPGKNLGSFMGGSGHETTKSGALLIYSFDGEKNSDGVSLYGPVGPNGSPFNVRVDNGPTRGFTTKQEFYTPQSLLYHATSLGPGNHNLTLVYQPTSPEQTFAIDYAVVFTTAAPSTTSQIGHGSGGMTSLTKGALAGLGVSVALLLAMSGMVLRLLWKRQRQPEAEHTEVPRETVLYRDNPTAPPRQMEVHTPLIMPQTSMISASSTSDRYRFHKPGLKPAGYQRNENSVSTLPSTTDSDANTSTWVSRISAIHSRPSLSVTENPPQYTEDALDAR